MSLASTTLDGLNTFNRNRLPTVADTTINRWSFGTIKQIEVTTTSFRKHTILWKDVTLDVYDKDLFFGIVKDLMNEHNWSKEQTLDYIFEQ